MNSNFLEYFYSQIIGLSEEQKKSPDNNPQNVERPPKPQVIIVTESYDPNTENPKKYDIQK
ncbi:MAG: hypothetical protein SOY60_05005 [Fusobacterium gastrosuis]|uniref:hypothetical protein n=1 Tax=Fusobacterium gastrosuis TaxID=1755100 RepID=UPI002970E19B|nr:hypothetical protein [Fusobacteriaceae bacterium]MDY4011004.1 hypothetical protein [Fusobacterium gastrosuis]MDY5713544.1 hypothetical protein [Fusobacterium gastrosuis]